MSDPIYEIPVLAPGANVDGWTPGIRRRSRAEAAELPFSETTGFGRGSEPAPRTEPAYDPAQSYGFGSALPVADQRPAEPEYRRAGSFEPPAESTPAYPAPAEPLSGQSELHRAMQEAAAAAGRADFGLADAEPEPVVLREISLAEALHAVVRLKASDLHVTADAPPMIRVNGGLKAVEGASPWSREKISAELRSIANERQLAMFDEHLELDFAHTLTEESRFRVNFYLQRGAIGAAFRLIPTEIKRLSDLGVPDSVSRFAALPRGLVLVTGPTGSGKSTTLAGLIDLVNRTRADHIVTVEDPIEFMHKNQKSIVNQREVGADTHSFASALKHVLRQDPDVILIGELRDLETISVALTAAETGHLVFATLHTQDAAQTIDRVIDVFPSHQQDQVRTQLAGTLQGVVSQTLVPKASGSGRVVATEVMVITPALANLIREGKTYQILSSMQAGRDLGMHTMDQHLAELVNSGRITAQAAMAKAHDPDGFQRMLHCAQSPTEAAARAMQASDIDYGDSYSARLDR